MRNQTIKKISRLDDTIEYSLKDEDYIDREDVFLAIEQSINQLNELDKSLIILKYYEGKSSKEIAIILNVPEKYVPVFMQRARKKLGDFYQNFNMAA
jgi:RNA polymerase sigma-70 factor, ECF subfamily